MSDQLAADTSEESDEPKTFDKMVRGQYNRVSDVMIGNQWLPVNPKTLDLGIVDLGVAVKGFQQERQFSFGSGASVIWGRCHPSKRSSPKLDKYCPAPSIRPRF